MLVESPLGCEDAELGEVVTLYAKRFIDERMDDLDWIEVSTEAQTFSRKVASGWLPGLLALSVNYHIYTPFPSVLPPSLPPSPVPPPSLPRPSPVSLHFLCRRFLSLLSGCWVVSLIQPHWIIVCCLTVLRLFWIT